MNEAREILEGIETSPAGKKMNCNQWGTYEPPNSSSTSAYCSGGIVDGQEWGACPSKEECRAEKNARVMRPSYQSNRSQPVFNHVVDRPMGMGPHQFRPSGTTLGSQPTSIPQQQHYQQAPQVVTPQTTNPYLSTQRVDGMAARPPTYLPAPDEPFMRRLGANMFIGALDSVAHSMSSFLRNVDIFPYKGPKK